MTDKPYRKNVGMVVFNAKGDVIVGERVHFPGSWQFPQGGIDENEDYIDAAKRELFEELGIKDAIYVGEYPDWIPYDFPNNLHLNKSLQKYRGQMQRWILYFWDGAITDCDLEHHEIEFLSVRYMKLSETIDAVVDFKKKVYEQFIPLFSQWIENYIAEKQK
ncbi:RNA pyrophosphohydrolase [Leptospira ognonensis]|uniref:RNA pyrophosphohydrolase n=1 Tax=Leptospira ognonensis TaxID=2484945 RepID=A0A4R9K4H7_9LEPT|nr:RNA pyrophosphohydrolase [Leptospira ognonensis]TGL60366.1 RNA pyrophosphohydrolase [Leptospira ognonensis]